MDYSNNSNIMGDSSDNKRIAKNTMFLYVRMLLILFVTLYTSRVVLHSLGDIDFGIFNVVGGVISLFSFVSSALAGATQRYLTFEIGSGNLHRLKETFSASFTIYLFVSVFIILLSETLGLWLLKSKLVIPVERLWAAKYVFHFCILSCILSVLQVPYYADIIAHERMNVFALISVIEVLFKLGIVFCLELFMIDKLVLYSILLCLVQILVFTSYVVYCRNSFPECRIRICKNYQYIKEMCGFAGWTLFGNLAVVGYTQGINILLNIFFGPTINTARGISVQVQNAVQGFVSNFQTAINPQITKKYAVNDISGMHSLLMTSSKLSFYLMLVFNIPLIFLSGPILELWLGNVPDYTQSFMILSLIIMQINTIANPLTTGVSATGKIRLYQIVVGICQLMIVPLSYLALSFGFIPESVYYVHFGVAVIAQILRIIIVLPKLNLSYSLYLKRVLVPISIVSIIVVSLSLLARQIVNTESLFLLCPIYLTIALVTILFVGLSSYERGFVKQFLTNIISAKQ